MIDTQLFTRIASNVERIRGRIADAAARAGRQADDIQFIAVTKYVDEPEIRALVEAGCRALGESRPQQLWERADQLSDLDVEWHLIGQLQRNKVRRTLPLIQILHSGDRLRLLKAVHNEWSAHQTSTGAGKLRVMLEVNVSGDGNKHGFAPEELERSLEAIGALESLEIAGLMAMAGRESSAEEARQQFAQLRELRDRLRAVAPANAGLEHLSMGMSGDFEQAIAEGSTMVRIGSALYET